MILSTQFTGRRAFRQDNAARSRKHDRPRCLLPLTSTRNRCHTHRCNVCTLHRLTLCWPETGWLWNVSGSATMLWMDLPFLSWLGSCWCSALRSTHSLLTLWEHGCTVGIDQDPPVWPSIQHDGGYQSASSLWIVECGVGAVKWTCGVIERCGSTSVSQHWVKFKKNSILWVMFKKKGSILWVMLKKKVQFFESCSKNQVFWVILWVMWKEVHFFESCQKEGSISEPFLEQFNSLSHFSKKVQFFEFNSLSHTTKRFNKVRIYESEFLTKTKFNSLSHVKKKVHFFESCEREGWILWVRERREALSVGNPDKCWSPINQETLGHNYTTALPGQKKCPPTNESMK